MFGHLLTKPDKRKKEKKNLKVSQPLKKEPPEIKLKKRCYYACQSQEGHISRDSFPPGNESNRDLRY